MSGRRPERPLDRGGLDQGQARALVAASVVVAALVARRPRRRRRAAARGPRHRGAGPGRHPAARRRDDQAAAGDDRGRPRMAPATTRAGSAPTAATRSAGWRGPSTGWPTTSARSTARRDLVATVSHELRTPLAGLSRCSRTSRTASSPPTARARRCSRPSGSRTWCATCWTSPGSRRARWRCGPAGRGRRGCSTRRSPSAGPPAGAVRWDVDIRRTSSSRPTRPGCTSSWPTCSTTPSGTARPAARCGSARVAGVRWVLEVRRRGAGIAPADRERIFSRFGPSTTPAPGRHRPRPGHRPLGRRPARRRHPAVDPPPARTARCSASCCRSPPARPPDVPRRPRARTHPPHRPRPPHRRPRPPAPAPHRPHRCCDPLFGRSGRTGPARAAPGGWPPSASACWPGWCSPSRPPGLGLASSCSRAGSRWRAPRDTGATRSRSPALALARAAVRCRSLLRDAAWIGVLCLLAGELPGRRRVARAQPVSAFVLAGAAWPLAGLRGIPGWAAAARVTGRRRRGGCCVTAIWSVLGGAGLRAAVRLGRRPRRELGRRRAPRHPGRLGRAARSSSRSRSPARCSPRRTSP